MIPFSTLDRGVVPRFLQPFSKRGYLGLVYSGLVIQQTALRMTFLTTSGAVHTGMELLGFPERQHSPWHSHGFYRTFLDCHIIAEGRKDRFYGFLLGNINFIVCGRVSPTPCCCCCCCRVERSWAVLTLRLTSSSARRSPTPWTPTPLRAPVISSPLENSSGAVDHLNELALIEQDAGSAHSEASEAFRVTARLAAPFAANGELGLRRLIYCDDDPETGCRIYTGDPMQAGDAGDEDTLYE